MPSRIRYASLAGGNLSVDLDDCAEYLSVPLSGDPPTPCSETVSYFYLLPDGKRWIQAFGNHISRAGYSTPDGRYVPVAARPDARWMFIETHPVRVAHTFLIDRMQLPVVLEQYRHLAEGPAYTEWLEWQGPGLPGSQVARESEPRRHLAVAQGDPPGGTTDPPADASTTPGKTSEAKVTADRLTPNDWKLLRATKALAAVDSDHPMSRESICTRAGTGHEDSKHNQESFERLKGAGLIDARKAVGTWLTAKGHAALDAEKR
jgi:hypothetical protein